MVCAVVRIYIVDRCAATTVSTYAEVPDMMMGRYGVYASEEYCVSMSSICPGRVHITAAAYRDSIAESISACPTEGIQAYTIGAGLCVYVRRSRA
jgi:hypothetical protein